MKVLVVHNYYQQAGGEDTVFTAETEILRRNGNEVIEYTDSNERLRFVNPAAMVLNTLWSSDTKKNILEIIKRYNPDIAHFHNTFLLISPSAYYACREMGVPVIQSLHNPRLICPAASFYRAGKVCEDCLGKTPPWPGMIHGCYRGSIAKTSVVAAMLTLHRLLKTWVRAVDKYIVFTEFYRNKFIQSGIPCEKIAIKPHFLESDPGCRTQWPGKYALFVGRLDEVKGIYTLLDAWKYTKNIPLKIVGCGDLAGEIKDYINKNPSIPVEMTGRLSKRKVFDCMKNARFLIWPSEGHYETFGMVALEAFACGVPVIASRTGVLSENIEDGRTGLHFAPGDAKDMSAKVGWAWNNPEDTSRMGKAARQEYEEKYTSKKNYRMLRDIYEKTIEESKLRRRRVGK